MFPRAVRHASVRPRRNYDPELQADATTERNVTAAEKSEETTSGITGITLRLVSRLYRSRGGSLFVECNFEYSSALSRFLAPDDGLPHYKRIFFSISLPLISFSPLFLIVSSELTQYHAT